MDNKSSREQATSEERRKRQPMDKTRRTMSISPKIKEKLEKGGYHLHWINDKNGGVDVQRHIDNGYDFVDSDGEIIIGDSIKAHDKGRRIKTLANKRTTPPEYCYLMAIKQKFYNEDRAELEKINKKVDDAIKAGSPRGVGPLGVAPSQGGEYNKTIQYEP